MKKTETILPDEVLPKKAGLMAKFEEKGELILRAASAMVVQDEHGRARAAEVREQARQVIKEIEAEFKEDREAAHGLWKRIVARIKRMTDTPEKVIAILEEKMSAYLSEQERIRRAAEDKARKEAEAEAERERQKLLKAAEKAEAKGNAEAAELKRMEAENVQVIAPVIAGPDKMIRTDSGSTSASKDFDLVIVDPTAIIRALAAGAMPIACVDFKLGVIKRFAEMKRVGDQLPVIPGCRLTPKYNFSGRAAK